MEVIKIKSQPAPHSEDRGATAAFDQAAPPKAVGKRDGTRLLPLLIRIVISLALVAGLIAGALAVKRYLVESKPEPPKNVAQERPRYVDVVVAEVADVQPTLRVYGQIFAGRSVDLRMLVDGEIVKLSPNFVEGGRISRHEPLVTLDTFEYDGALVRTKAELSEAEANIAETKARIALEEQAVARAVEQQAIARRELERFERLVRTQAVSEATLDGARTRMSVADAAVEQRSNQIPVLQAQLARQEAALDRLKWAVRQATRNLRNTVLNAPFEGVLSNISAEVGRFVRNSDQVATLVDLDRFEVRFTLTDAQYGRLVEKGPIAGRPVTVLWEGGNVKLEAKGSIDRVSPVISSAAGGFDVFARLERSPATEVMRPGAFVTVLTNDSVYGDVVRVPETALHPGDRVFAVGADDRLIEIPVTVAGYDKNAVLLRGELKSGMQIMTSRLPDAGPGILISPRKTKTPADG